MSLLVVDDDADVCTYIADLLEHEGYHVKTLTDPTKAVDEFRKNQYHAVVLDLMMPKLPGVDVLRQIRDVDDDAAVIILTGYPSVETAMDAIGSGVVAYIKKPFGMEEFREVVARIAKKKGLAVRPEDELHQAIGRKIREHRLARDLTLRQLANRTKLSVSLLSQIERAESSASISSLYKVAAALDLKLHELFGKF